MNKIYKYFLQPGDNLLDLPIGHETLSFQQQGSEFCLWVLVDPNAEMRKRAFRIFGTGHPLPNVPQRFVGTVQCGPLVFHCFEGLL